MRARHPTLHRLPGAADVLWLLLLAAVLVPLPASLSGWWVPLPFGLSFGGFAAIAIAIALGWIGWHAWRARWRGVPRALGGVAAVGLLATLFAFVIERRSNGFYTGIALFEGMFVLLLLRAAASLLRLFGARTGRDRAPFPAERSDAQPVTASAFADLVAAAIVWLVVTFWILTAFAWRDVALAIMLLATGCGGLEVVLRLPDAVRGTRSRNGDVRDEHARPA